MKSTLDSKQAKQNDDLNNSSNLKALFYLGFTVLAFSSIEIIANPIRHIIDPMAITFWRFAIGTAFLLPFLLLKKPGSIKNTNPVELLKLCLLGCLNIIISMGAHAVCIKFSKASTAAILIAANPIATNFFSWIILKEKMSLKRIFSLSLGMLGIALIAIRPDPGADTLTGIIAGIIGLTGFGLYTVLSKKMVQNHGSLKVTVLSCSTALLIYLPLLKIMDKKIIPDFHLWPYLIGLGVFGSGLGYVTFFKALELMPAGRASYLFFFKPPVAVFLAWLILGEQIKYPALIGTALIMSGIFMEIKKLDKGVNSNTLSDQTESGVSHDKSQT